MGKNLIALAALAAFATPLYAADSGIINQAGTYERTLQFYLHPAHGFAGSAPKGDHPAVIIAKRKDQPMHQVALQTYLHPAHGFAMDTTPTQPIQTTAPVTSTIVAGANNLRHR